MTIIVILIKKFDGVLYGGELAGFDVKLQYLNSGGRAQKEQGVSYWELAGSWALEGEKEVIFRAGRGSKSCRWRAGRSS